MDHIIVSYQVDILCSKYKNVKIVMKLSLNKPLIETVKIVHIKLANCDNYIENSYFYMVHILLYFIVF